MVATAGGTIKNQRREGILLLASEIPILISKILSGVGPINSRSNDTIDYTAQG